MISSENSWSTGPTKDIELNPPHGRGVNFF